MRTTFTVAATGCLVSAAFANGLATVERRRDAAAAPTP
jgi:hypothetical protein